jgi:outer membrane lipoprotein-sorting protein
MSLTSSRRWRWAVPGVAAAAIAGTALVTSTTASADEHPTLAPRTAGALLASLADVRVAGLSGQVVQTSRLGLPELPSSGAEGSLSLQSFASGSRTLSVWAAGPDRQRIALLGDAAESTVVRSGRDVWTYSSATTKVSHLVLPAERAADPAPAPELSVTPQAAAAQALAAVDPTTAVTVDATARVAGRPAYQLVLTPRDGRTLVGSVRLALDSATSLPLRVQVFARGGTKPAAEVGFTSISLRTPGDGVFRFTPPAGSPVTERTLPDRPADPPSPAVRPDTGATVLGRGWTAVAVLPGAATGLPAGGLLDRLTTPVPGGRLVTSALLTAFLRDDGTVFVGAVGGADLQRVASTGKGL